MNCNEFLSGFSEYLDDALDLADRVRFEAHRQGCRDCRRYAEVVRDGIRILRSTGDVELPPSFRERIQSRIDEERALKRIQSGDSGTGASTTAVLAVAIVLAAIAWAPMLRSQVAEFTLPTIVVGAPGPAPIRERPGSTSLFQSLSPYGTAARTSDLWGNPSSVLREYSSLRGRARVTSDAMMLQALDFE